MMQVSIIQLKPLQLLLEFLQTTNDLRVERILERRTLKIGIVTEVTVNTLLGNLLVGSSIAAWVEKGWVKFWRKEARLGRGGNM
jgi:hypothetical protein